MGDSQALSTAGQVTEVARTCDLLMFSIAEFLAAPSAEQVSKAALEGTEAAG
jgi:hypothetical protein